MEWSGNGIFGLKWGYFKDWDLMGDFGSFGVEWRGILMVEFLSWCVDLPASESERTANTCSGFKYPRLFYSENKYFYTKKMRKNVQITHFTNVVYFSNRYKNFCMVYQKKKTL